MLEKWEKEAIEIIKRKKTILKKELLAEIHERTDLSYSMLIQLSQFIPYSDPHIRVEKIGKSIYYKWVEDNENKTV